MGRYIGPKMKKRRRLGLATEGESIRKKDQRTARLSAYGERLLQKQRLKFIYGVMERQMKRYAREALKGTGNPQIELLRRLETRLDNIAYRLGFGKTREQARQTVNHGHIVVDGRKVDIASYEVKPGQTIGLAAKVLKRANFLEQVKNNRKEGTVLGFLEYGENQGRLLSVPSENDLPKNVEMNQVLEFYRRII
jgi:small subunit ribosomal protein S4